MPVIKSAQKKLRKDRKRTKRNKDFSELLKTALKKAKKLPTEKSIKEAVILIDKAVKNNVIHKNKAARVKSGLSKLIKNPSKKTIPIKPKSLKKTKKKIS